MAELRESEIRARLAELDISEAIKVIKNFEESANPVIISAVLRDPFGGNVAITDSARAMWREFRDRSDPTGRAVLDLGLDSLEWAKRQVAVLQHAIARITGYQRHRLIELTHQVANRGWRAFGIEPGEIATFEAATKARR